MKETKPNGWLINDGSGEFFTSKKGDLTVAERFNWKVTPLYSAQSLAEVKAEAVRDAAQKLFSYGCDADAKNTLEEYANQLKEG